MMRVEVRPELLRWARERAEVPIEDLVKISPKYERWESGEENPTFKQLETFAKKTHTPFGYFFLDEPPDMTVPIPDFRTMGSDELGRPSPDLLDTIYACQERQAWYREHARSIHEEPLHYVGSAELDQSVLESADDIRATLNLEAEARTQSSTWKEALRSFIRQADDAGILVMVNGVVGNNTHRKLDPEEFRGFALSDDLAPLVFINGADTKAAQMFTLAHELAHIWLGRSALSDVQAPSKPTHRVERWCNQVAAEVLVPLDELRRAYRHDAPLPEEMKRLARHFKVSTLVVLRRIHDAGGISEPRMWQEYRREADRLQSILSRQGGGGNFYHTLTSRVGDRFARAVVGSTLEGQTLRLDALRMLGGAKLSTLHELARRLEVS